MAIPLIRGFALLPALRWLGSQGVSPDAALAAVDLPPSVLSEPLRPVPLVHAAALLRNAAQRFGPDTPYRILSTAPAVEIAMLGKIAIGCRTPGEALGRIVAALPCYCSHEQVSVEMQPGRYVVREFFAYRFDPETRHLLLQYAAAMIDRVLAMGGDPPPRFERVEIPPHPVEGVRHLVPWLGDAVTASRSRGLMAVVDERIMHRPFGSVGRNRLGARVLTEPASLRGDGTLSGSVRAVVRLMMEDDEAPTLARVVAASGTSERSLQRQLGAEGTSFTELLATLRQEETLRLLTARDRSIAAIAASLGYSDQASFTRAFRRWTGTPPSRFRARMPSGRPAATAPGPPRR